MKALRYCLNVIGVVVAALAIFALVTVFVTLIAMVASGGSIIFWMNWQYLPGAILGLLAGRLQWQTSVSKVKAPESFDAFIRRVMKMRYTRLAYHIVMGGALTAAGLWVCRDLWDTFSALDAGRVKEVREFSIFVEAYRLLGPKGAMGLGILLWAAGLLIQVGKIMQAWAKLRQRDAAAVGGDAESR